MKELGWDSLQTQRELQKLSIMHKVQHKVAPPYLIEACPPLVGEISNYNLKNVDNITLPEGKKAGYFNSFMPSAIRSWNKLDRDTKNQNTIESFKYHLKKSKCLKRNKLYKSFNGISAINHTRMRLGLSGLKAQRHAYNHVALPTCDLCGAHRDDAMHYLLQCRVFNNMRIPLLDAVRALYLTKNIRRDMSRTIVQKELVHCLLHGDARLTERENVTLFVLVQQFIGASKRF
jgi:hypothetical protein